MVWMGIRKYTEKYKEKEAVFDKINMENYLEWRKVLEKIAGIKYPEPGEENILPPEPEENKIPAGKS